MSPRRRSQERRFRIDYAESAVVHLRHLRAHERAKVIDGVEERLSFEPAVETRNRKRMDDNALEAEYELRLGAPCACTTQ